MRFLFSWSPDDEQFGLLSCIRHARKDMRHALTTPSNSVEELVDVVFGWQTREFL